MSNIDKKNQHWFQDWANEYDATLGKVRRHHKLLDLVVKMAGIRQGDRVLDIGCGTGLLSLKFLSRKACRITAFDGSQQMLDIFNKKITSLQLSETIQCKKLMIEKMRFKPGSFDIAAATVALHHVREKEPVLRSIRTCLDDGGRLLIGEIDMDTTGRHGDPKRLRRILDYLTEEFVLAMKEGGAAAFERMYANGKKHIFNDGEYCIGFKQWAKLCTTVGFRNVEIVPVTGFEWFKVLVATK